MLKYRLFSLLSLCGIIVNAAVIAFSWNDIPDRFPLHFSVNGTPDSFGPKWLVWIFPVISMALYFLFGTMAGKPWIVKNYPYVITPETKKLHYSVIKETAGWLKFGTTWIFTFIGVLLVNNTGYSDKTAGYFIFIPIALVIAVTLLIIRKGKRIDAEYV